MTTPQVNGQWFNLICAPERELTDEEQRAIASLRRLARRWPSTLGLFSWSGSLCVIRMPAGGGLLAENDQPDVVETIHGIANGGGAP